MALLLKVSKCYFKPLRHFGPVQFAFGYRHANTVNAFDLARACRLQPVIRSLTTVEKARAYTRSTIPGTATPASSSKPSSPLSQNLLCWIPPQKGFLSILPASWVPYAELMRLDKPTGFYLFYLPYLFGTLYASCIAIPIITPTSLLTTNIILLAGTVILRGAACTWNDNIDRELDRQVSRCRLRAIARGAVTPRNGHIFTAAQSGGTRTVDPTPISMHLLCCPHCHPPRVVPIR